MRVLLVLLAGSAALAQAPAPDVVIYHAKIFRGIAGQPFAEAIALRGERIVAVGTADDVLKTAAESTRKIDGAGRVLIPGFNDAHIHLNPQPPSNAVQLDGNRGVDGRHRCCGNAYRHSGSAGLAPKNLAGRSTGRCITAADAEVTE